MSYTRTSANTNNATSNKMGVVKKCPNCGATVEMSMVRCPECGYHFGGVEANSSARELAELLYRATGKNEYKRSNIVVNFPVPTTKADLLEFMADLLYRAKHYEESGEYKMASAFKAKFKECAMKARIYFRNDPDFQPLFEIESKIKIKTKKIINVSGSTKRYLKYFGCLSLFAVWFAVIEIGSNWKDIKRYFREQKTNAALTQFSEDYKHLPVQVDSLVKSGQLKDAELILNKITIPKVIKDTDDYSEVASYIDNAFMIAVKYYIGIGDKESARRIGDIFYTKVGPDFFNTMTCRLLSENGIEGFI